MSITTDDLYRKLYGRGGTTKGTDIDMSESGRGGGVSTGQPFKFTDSINYQMKITESGSYTYVAYANPGTAESEAAWKVMRLDNSSGLTVKWADKNTNFDNVATDLTLLDFS